MADHRRRPELSPRRADDFKFAAAVAGFGMLLRDSQYKGNADVRRPCWRLAQGGTRRDAQGYREEFVDMVRKAKQLKGE